MVVVVGPRWQLRSAAAVVAPHLVGVQRCVHSGNCSNEGLRPSGLPSTGCVR